MEFFRGGGGVVHRLLPAPVVPARLLILILLILLEEELLQPEVAAGISGKGFMEDAPPIDAPIPPDEDGIALNELCLDLICWFGTCRENCDVGV